MSVIPHTENCVAVVHLRHDNSIYCVQPRHNTLDMEMLTQQKRAVAVAAPPPAPTTNTSVVLHVLDLI